MGFQDSLLRDGVKQSHRDVSFVWMLSELHSAFIAIPAFYLPHFKKQKICWTIMRNLTIICVLNTENCYVALPCLKNRAHPAYGDQARHRRCFHIAIVRNSSQTLQ